MFSNKTQSKKHKISHVKMNILLSLQNHVYCCKWKIFNLNHILGGEREYISSEEHEICQYLITIKYLKACSITITTALLCRK